MKMPGILTFVTVLSLIAPAAADSITIANGNDYPPYTDQKLKRGGITSHIVEEAFKVAGWTFEYKWLPWKRGYDFTKNLKIDAAIPWARNKERASLFLFSDAIMSVTEQIWATADSIDKSYSDLKGKRGCLPLGYLKLEYLKSMLDAGVVKMVSPTDMTACFKMLQAKRVDFIVTTGMQATSIIKKTATNPNNLKAIITSTEIIETHLIVGKNHPKGKEIVAAFNRGLAVLKASGEYDAIIASH